MAKLLFILSIISFSKTVAQDISIEGKVVDAVNSKGIVANVRYKSYPTGSLTGRFSDSTFTLPIFGSSKYQITADAKGFIPHTIIVDPREFPSKRIFRTIQLTSKGGSVRLENLIFEIGRAAITPKSYSGLDEIVAMLKENTPLVIQLEGHTDNIGNAEKNFMLSQDRVNEVKKYLTSKGIGKDRVKTKAFGGSQPISLDRTEEGRTLNRRVEMRILKD
jgi:OmpA-OmpF porin, OOP family